MPESICLHIQDRESGPIRVLEIPWISVRIGCAAYCEVRLAERELAEEACRLQRRGRTWYLIPLGSKGSILVQDRPIERPCPLPFDLPFRIGSIFFTLRQNRSSDPDWEMYRTLSPTQQRQPMSINPLPLALPADARNIAAIVPPRAQQNIVHHFSIPVAPRGELPPERSPDPHPVNPWEARWKAAGTRLQSDRKQPLPPARPHPGRPADRYESAPLKEPSVPLSMKAELAALPSLTRGFATSPLIPAAAPGYPVAPRISPRSRLDADFPIRTLTQPAEPLSTAVQPEKVTTHDRQPGSADDHANCQSDDPATDHGHAVAHGDQTLDDHSAWNDAAWIAQPPQQFVADTSWTGTISFLETGSSEVIASSSTEACRHVDAGEPDRAVTARIPNLRTATLLDPGTPPDRDRRQGSENELWPKNSRHLHGLEPDPPRLKTGPDLPSAKDILAAVAMRPSVASGKPSTRMSADQDKPTEIREPDQWFPHLWLAWPPTALLVIAVGIAGSLLSLRWSSDSFNASVVSQRLLTGSEKQGREKPLPESVVPPESSWWKTTPLHLVEWGVYLGRMRTGNDRTDEGRELVEAAVRISPINPTARLARAQLASKPGESTGRVLDLGLSRDAVSLAWSARALRHAGRKESAIRAYREALRIACDNDCAPDWKPTFNDEPTVRRYFLPGETTARAIVRELIDDADWTFQDWSEALPKNTVAVLAAVRLLREHERPEAQALLKQILNQEQENVAPGAEGAVQTAMIAEAHALLSQWREAEQQYHQAIDRMSDLVVKRSWWFNLASVALQFNDEAQRKVALEAALEAPASDDISRRALELQRASEPSGRLRPSGNKAN